MIYPNSYPMKNDTPEVEVPQLLVGHDNLYKKSEVLPRVYHKYLNRETRNHIYGEQADALYGNVSEIEVADLSANQIDFLLGQQRDFN